MDGQDIQNGVLGFCLIGRGSALTAYRKESRDKERGDKDRRDSRRGWGGSDWSGGCRRAVEMEETVDRVAGHLAEAAQGRCADYFGQVL